MITELTESILETCDAVNMGDDLILVNDLSKLPLPSEPWRTKHIIAALCLKGSAKYSVDTKERTIGVGDLIVIQKDRVTDNYALSDDLRGKAIVMSKNFLDEMVKDVQELHNLFLFSRVHSVVSLTKKEIKEILLMFDIIRENLQEPDNHFRRDIVRSQMTTMIYCISNAIFREQRLAFNGPASRAEEIFTQYISLVEKNFRTKRKVSWYANQMRITSKHLSETIKAVSSRSPVDWIDNYVTLEIRVLLRNTTKPIKTIAEELNFPTQSFLGKYFKDHVGLSPSDYRRKKNGG